jgi:hypothetical protein
MEEERNKNTHIAQHYKMRYYENEFPHEGELVMVGTFRFRDNPRSQRRMDATSPCSSTTDEAA